MLMRALRRDTLRGIENNFDFSSDACLTRLFDINVGYIFTVNDSITGFIFLKL